MYRIVNRTFRWINERGRLLLIAPWCDHFGDIGETLHFGLLRARMEGKRAFFIFPRWRLFWKFRQARAHNPTLFDVRSPYRYLHLGHPLSTAAGVALSLIYGTMKVLYLFWRKSARGIECLVPGWRQAPFDSWHTGPTIGRDCVFTPKRSRKFSWDAVDLTAWRKALAQPLPVDLARDAVREGERLRREMGLPSDARFACLHVRESATYGDSAVYAHRDSDILNYLPAIEEITREGVWVVRIGDPAMRPLPPLPRTIDYVHTPFFSRLMSIYLISRCGFLVACPSGPLSVARLFGKPELLLNVDHVGDYPLRPGDLGIYKRAFVVGEDRYLSLEEFLTLPLAAGFNPLNGGIRMVENTPEDMLGAVREFLRHSPGTPRSALQRRFHEARLSAMRDWVHEFGRRLPVAAQRHTEMCRKAVVGASADGSICRSFLEKHRYGANNDAGSILSH